MHAHSQVHGASEQVNHALAKQEYLGATGASFQKAAALALSRGFAGRLQAEGTFHLDPPPLSVRVSRQVDKSTDGTGEGDNSTPTTGTKNAADVLASLPFSQPDPDNERPSEVAAVESMPAAAASIRHNAELLVAWDSTEGMGTSGEGDGGVGSEGGHDPAQGVKRSRPLDGDEGTSEAETEAGSGRGRANKRRLIWTTELHARFRNAIMHLGVRNAVPKTILQLMNVEGMTRENVASHLQKYRLYLKRLAGYPPSAAISPDALQQIQDQLTQQLGMPCQGPQPAPFPLGVQAPIGMPRSSSTECLLPGVPPLVVPGQPQLLLRGARPYASAHPPQPQQHPPGTSAAARTSTVAWLQQLPLPAGVPGRGGPAVPSLPAPTQSLLLSPAWSYPPLQAPVAQPLGAVAGTPGLFLPQVRPLQAPRGPSTCGADGGQALHTDTKGQGSLVRGASGKDPLPLGSSWVRGAEGHAPLLG